VPRRERDLYPNCRVKVPESTIAATKGTVKKGQKASLAVGVHLQLRINWEAAAVQSRLPTPNERARDRARPLGARLESRAQGGGPIFTAISAYPVVS